MKSIELIQKSEPLALSYDQENGFWLGQSGGKDSQVLMHLAQLANVKFKAYFSPTSVDPPEVIRFIRRNYPETEFTPLTHSIYDEFMKRKCLPSMRIRYCCEVFKEQGGKNKVVLVGVRHSESARRAKRQAVEVTGHKFSGDLEGFKEWSDKRKAKKRKQFDQFSDHKESMVTCINGKDKIVISPILDWLDSDVWEFLNDVLRVPHCELYDQGWTRIGCICCPMASPKNTQRDIERWPYVKEKWIKTIMKIRRESLEATSQITPPHSDTSTVAETTGYLVSRPGWIPPQYFQSKWAEGGYYASSIRQGLQNWGGGKIHRQDLSAAYGAEFLDGVNEQGAAVNAESQSTEIDDTIEREIAEAIFDWWISKKPYKQWYSDKYLQQKFDF